MRGYKGEGLEEERDEGKEEGMKERWKEGRKIY